MSEPMIVRVEQGKLRGAVIKNVDGGSYIFFRGIPFADPPIGELRFQDPQPAKPWNGIRDALKEGPNCAQSRMITREIVGEDDCLYLNVATTSLNESRPVMVWIHGGGFAKGSGDSDLYSPDYFMKKDIVFVSINYRLGCLGFFSLEHEVAPGNQGLKDQIAALKWVKENIAVFGGDPNNVTIFGSSAGSASVHYLALSPLAKGLFHKGICQSGVAINPAGRKLNPRPMGYRLVAALGNETSDPQEAVSFLRTISASKLIEAQEQLLSPIETFKMFTPFGPAVDAMSLQPVLPHPLEELVAEGVHVPLIIGYSTHEGILFLLGAKDETFTFLDAHFEMAVPAELACKDPSRVQEIARVMRKLYFGDVPITKHQQDNYVQFLGDIHLVNGIQQIVDVQQRKNSPTYFYRFSFQGNFSLAETLYRTSAKGTAHGDEIGYMFHVPIFRKSRVEPGTPDRIVLERFIQMWTDFAKTGNPTPKVASLITEKWLPVSNATRNYLEINENLETGVFPGRDKWEAWNRIYSMT